MFREVDACQESMAMWKAILAASRKAGEVLTKDILDKGKYPIAAASGDSFCAYCTIATQETEQRKAQAKCVACPAAGRWESRVSFTEMATCTHPNTQFMRACDSMEGLVAMVKLTEIVFHDAERRVNDVFMRMERKVMDIEENGK